MYEEWIRERKLTEEEWTKMYAKKQAYTNFIFKVCWYCWYAVWIFVVGIASYMIGVGLGRLLS